MNKCAITHDKNNGFSQMARRFHIGLLQIVQSRKGEILTTAQIRKIVDGDPGLAGYASWIYPSDHCINHTNKGACDCALTAEAIFEKISRGNYRVIKTADNK